MIERVLRRWLTGWVAVGHLGLDLLLALPYLTVALLTVASAALVPVAVGVPLLGLSMLGVDGAARLERARASGSTGMLIPAPQPRPRPRWWSGLVDPARWRAVGYLLVQPLWGLLGAALVLVLLSAALAALALPGYWRGSGAALAAVQAQGTAGLLPAWALGLGVFVGTPLLASALVAVELGLGRALLGPARREVEAVLNRRVDALTSTRGAVVDSVEAERQRIERDLHDGPQQQLVSLSMGIGLAQRRLEQDPEGAAQLLAEVQRTAREAMTQMRQVARGIRPPVLADRGLDAALSALTGHCPVPVTVHVDLPVRPSPTLESIAYFCVSEALTNVAKHAGATQVRVDVQVEGPDLLVRVHDDGVGGAGADGTGTGLRGLADRARAVDGDLDVQSPPGGPTTLTVRLPFSPPRRRHDH